MIKKILIFEFLILVTMLIFTSCGNNNLPDTNVESNNSFSAENEEIGNIISENTEYVEFRIMPSPPKYKKIDDGDALRKIYTLINSAEKTYKASSENAGGWDMYLHFSDGTQISFCGNIMYVDSAEYTVNNDLKEELLSVYYEADAEEITV